MEYHETRSGAQEQARADEERRWSRWMALACSGNDGGGVGGNTARESGAGSERRDAYENLMGEVAKAIEAYLHSRFGAADGLEDCVQESLLAIHRARHSYLPERPFRPWLFTIVRHKTIDHFRRLEVRTRGRVDGDPIDLDASIHPGQPGSDPELRVDGAWLLDRLDETQREALHLTKFVGYSLDEAAAKVGVSTTAMKSRVHRALRQVRAMLGKEEIPL